VVLFAIAFQSKKEQQLLFPPYNFMGSYELMYKTDTKKEAKILRATNIANCYHNKNNREKSNISIAILKN
jgi:hypothetical protein